MDIFDLNSTEEREMMPGLHVKMMHSKNMTLAFWRIEKGAVLPEHDHPHEQIATINKGELELTVDGDVKVLTAVMVATIPGGASHSAVALTDCEMVDAFAPVREDLKQGN